MQRTEWSAPTDPDTASRRAAGRARYNRRRQLRAMLRQRKVLQLLPASGFRGVLAGIARQLGVHRSTICRDIRAIFRPRRGGFWFVEGFDDDDSDDEALG